MADIVNPQAIAFSNNEVRPLAESVRALKARIDSAMTQWFSGMNVLIPNDVNEILEDGRGDDGISRLNGDDIVGLMSILHGLQINLNTSGYADRISKPCVRPLQVQ